ncbi:transposase [Phocaeicola barnesiae]|nr:transposase [Phocaeicola barnesiae]MDM8310414.1 transposase [Phocaeicola barnesiae]
MQKHGDRYQIVLKEFLGEPKIKPLQSDGYNVYMYIDNELINMEHLCCLAHARAKFKYAYDQGCL